MNFFSRLSNIIGGFFSMFLKGVEEKNPAAVYEAAINERLRKHADLKKAISGIVYLRNKTDKEIEDITKELEEIEFQLEAAIESGEDEIAVTMIERQESLLSELTTKKAELRKVAAQAEDSKESLRTFQSEIEKLKREKEQMLAKVETAEARIKIQETLDGFSLDADVQALDGIRESIEKKVAEADVGAEMAESSLDKKMAKLKDQGAALRAKKKLAEMKRKKEEAAKQVERKKKGAIRLVKDDPKKL
jgi:phage shock protein A